MFAHPLLIDLGRWLGRNPLLGGAVLGIIVLLLIVIHVVINEVGIKFYIIYINLVFELGPFSSLVSEVFLYSFLDVLIIFSVCSVICKLLTSCVLKAEYGTSDKLS